MSAENLYNALESSREVYLQRARENARFTIPSLISLSSNRHDRTAGNDPLVTPWQSVGARGVNNLASKLLLALFPPNAPFFKLQIDDFVFAKEAEESGVAPGDIKADFESALSRVEQSVMSEFDARAFRVPSHEALKHLLVAGNVCQYIPQTGPSKVYHLDRYVARRDAMGTLTDLVIRDTYSRETLPKSLQPMVDITDPERDTEESAEYHVFTQVTLEDKRYQVRQEFRGQEIPDSNGSYKPDELPWIVLRGIVRDSEDYGRSYVEEYLGDLKTLDGLTQAVAEGAAGSAHLVYLVNPAGMTKLKDFMTCRNGGAIPGRPDDVQAVQTQKNNDFRVALEMIGRIDQRLSQAFLLNSSVQRQAERVTAEEVRFVAQELEDALGGIYSLLAVDFQLPLVIRLMTVMQKSNKIPKITDKLGGLLKPAVVTGLQALGRGHDLNKLDMFMGGLAELFGPEGIATWVNPGEYIKRRAVALGVNPEGLVRSAEEVQAAQQQAQEEQMGQQIAPEVVRGQMAAQQAAQQGGGE